MIVLHANPDVPAAVLTRIKALADRFPGEHELGLVVATGQRQRTRALTLGSQWTYAASSECLAALSEYGRVEVWPRQDRNRTVRAPGPPAALNPTPHQEDD